MVVWDINDPKADKVMEVSRRPHNLKLHNLYASPSIIRRVLLVCDAIWS